MASEVERTNVWGKSKRKMRKGEGYGGGATNMVGKKTMGSISRFPKPMQRRKISRSNDCLCAGLGA